jgi:hypothetical protein
MSLDTEPLVRHSELIDSVQYLLRELPHIDRTNQLVILKQLYQMVGILDRDEVEECMIMLLEGRPDNFVLLSAVKIIIAMKLSSVTLYSMFAKMIASDRLFHAVMGAWALDSLMPEWRRMTGITWSSVFDYLQGSPASRRLRFMAALEGDASVLKSHLWSLAHVELQLTDKVNYTKFLKSVIRKFDSSVSWHQRYDLNWIHKHWSR